MKILNPPTGISLGQGTNASGRANKPPMAAVGRTILKNLHNPPAIDSADLGR